MTSMSSFSLRSEVHFTAIAASGDAYLIGLLATWSLATMTHQMTRYDLFGTRRYSVVFEEDLRAKV